AWECAVMGKLCFVARGGIRTLPSKAARCYFPTMNTLAEIEAAVNALPTKQQRKLLERLAAKLAATVPKPSLHDLMKDGCGMVDSGIPDLATNKKHMRGYGR